MCAGIGPVLSPPLPCPQAHLSTGTYDNAGQLLLAVSQLLTNFKAYSNVPKVADLMATVARIKSMYYDKIMREFESLTELGVAEAMGGSGDTGRDAASLTALKQACEVVDALETGARDNLIKTFCKYGCSPWGRDTRTLHHLRCPCCAASSFGRLRPIALLSLWTCPVGMGSFDGRYETWKHDTEVCCPVHGECSNASTWNSSA